MKSVAPVPKTCGVLDHATSQHVVARLLLVSFVLISTSVPLSAGEISVLRDAQGHSVYINKDDPELRASVKRGGVAAALAVIEQRKHALAGIDEVIEQECLEQRLDPRLVRAIIEVESAWDSRARSRKGALGLMQLMPETALRFGVRDPFDARENIHGGTRYLRFLLDRFHENLNVSLAAYNAGEKAVAAWGNIPPYRETQAYIQQVEMIYAARQQEAASSATPITRSVEGARVVDYTNLD